MINRFHCGNFLVSQTNSRSLFWFVIFLPFCVRKAEGRGQKAEGKEV
ncbi:hypothetical protein [[Phormidium ambiguum] IAM M-71]|nr:hypothetical protein [Phormidium ambiguum]